MMMMMMMTTQVQLAATCDYLRVRLARALVGRIGVALLLLLIFASYSILLVFLICFSSFLFLASVLHETFTIMT